MDLEDIRALCGIPTLLHQRSVASTNSWAIAAARSDCPALPALFLTDRQTAGRGRGEHRWESSAGSLTFSLLVGRSWPVGHDAAGLTALVAADAICEALATEYQLECQKYAAP